MTPEEMALEALERLYSENHEGMRRLALENPDEFVLEDIKMVHYEVMNEEAVWIGIYLDDGRIFHLNIHGENLRVQYTDES